MLVNRLAICYAKFPKIVVTIKIVKPESTHVEVNTGSFTFTFCLECFSQEHRECMHVYKLQHNFVNRRESDILFTRKEFSHC